MNQIDIIKSDNDSREYKYFKMDNNLQCLIIVDKNESMCGACLNIEAGSILEANNVDGLAHFLEHMVFMGSKKYPESHDFMGTINKSGGETNASTAQTFTNYYFTINSDKFLETLDKFSGFFIAPLLDQKYIDKEINAVNSESVKNLLDDNWISQEIIRTLVDKQHPFNHYTCGTSESLTRPDIHNKLQEFHDKYYLGQYMSLVVFINNDINMNNLCSQILDTFGKINNNSDKINTRYGRLLKEKKIVYYVPTKNEHSLSVIFEFKRIKELLKAPYWFVKQIFSNQYKKSLYDFLLKKNYVTQTDITDVISLDDYDVFSFDFKLTDNGLESVQEVYSYVINYMNYFKTKIKNKDEYLEKIYYEYKQTNNNNFKYWEGGDITETIIMLSHLMQEDLPKENLLNFDTIFPDYNDFCNTCIDILDDYNYSVTVGSKKFSDICKDKFPIYNTCYKVDKLIILDHNIDTLPVINKFVCYDLQLNKTIIQSTVPEQISANYNLFYYGDLNFKTPTVDFKVIIKLPTILNDPLTYTSMLLFLNSAYSHINPYKNMALDASYIFSIRLEYDLLYIYISGYIEKIKLVIKLINKMFQKKFKEEHYTVAHYQLVKSLKNFNVSSPLTQMSVMVDKHLYKKYFTPDEQLEVVKNLSMEQCIDIFRKNFISARVNILCSGNVTKTQAYELSNYLYNCIGLKKQLDLNLEKDIINYDSPYTKRINTINKDEQNTVMSLNYNLFTIRKTNKWKSKILFARLCVAILSYKYFYSLRTQQQLGYIVRCKLVTFIVNSNIACVLQFLIQSPIKKASELIQLTQDFIKEQTKYIMYDMTEKEFKTYIQGEESKLLKKFTTLSSLNSYFTSALLDESLVFNLNNILLDKIKTFNINKFRNYYNKYIINNNNIFILGINKNN